MANSVLRCPFCDRKYKTRESLKAHIAAKEQAPLVQLAYCVTLCDLLGRLSKVEK